MEPQCPLETITTHLAVVYYSIISVYASLKQTPVYYNQIHMDADKLLSFLGETYKYLLKGLNELLARLAWLLDGLNSPVTE